jgi:hypothetical protein
MYFCLGSWQCINILLICSSKFVWIQVARIYVSCVNSPLQYVRKAIARRKTRCHVFDQNHMSQGSCNSSFHAINPPKMITSHYNLDLKRFLSSLIQKTMVLKRARGRGKLKQVAFVGFVRMVVSMVFVMAISFTVSMAPSCMYLLVT